MKNMLMVFLGGGAGSLLRYGLSLLLPSTPFPWATFTVNILGSILIGFFTVKLYAPGQASSSLFLLLSAGFCGGFTTFSTFSKESFQLLQQEQWGLFILYILASVGLCIGGMALGLFAGK